MTPDAISGVGAAAGTDVVQKPDKVTEASLDYDAFLQLLLAQMQNQDPLNPADSTEYVAQLATFSQVEQSLLTNNKLDALLASNAMSQIDGLIGKTVTTIDGATSGRVESVKILADGAVAVLENGSEVTVGSGLQISA